jgi:ABC-type Fe3+/spermidine/putrescine transport system ATPase subunit
MTLELSKISKRYGNVWALRDIDLRVESGEVLGLVGPHWSGKSTLLKIIAGRESRTPASSGPAGSHSVHYVETSRRSFISRLTNRSTDFPGERQNAFETAIREATDVLVIDDLFKGIDPAMRWENAERLRAVAREKGLSVVVSTDDFPAAAAVSDKIAILLDGEIRQYGTPEEIYETPASVSVAALTGRCNIFEARRLTSSKTELPEFQLIDKHFRLYAERADVAKLGAINRNVWLAIRPEHISISFGASFPEDNLVRAVVREIRFEGPTTTIRFDCDGLSLEAVVLRVVGLNIGDECMLGLPPDRIRILRN